MRWAEKHTCHAGERFVTAKGEWRPPGDRGPFRTCDYCGSIHPEDLVAALAKGARLDRADMKYGWPHKFYVAGGGVDHAKFYNLHVTDEHDDEARAALVDALWKHAGVRFEVEPGGDFRWDARTPHPDWAPPPNTMEHLR